MTNITQIIKCIDEYLIRNNQPYITAVDANKILAQVGLLSDSKDRPGSPLRKLLRAGKISHARQVGNKWRILRSENSQNIASTPPASKPESRKQTAAKPSGKDDIHICDIDFKTIDNLRRNGFLGFRSVMTLWQDPSLIPDIRGVYMVVRTGGSMPKFLTTGSGGHHKGKDPNVSIEKLRTKWVEDTCVLYIGKAGDEGCDATLRSRLRQYLKFGHGEAVGHSGGRYIWQIEDADNLLFCWKPLPSGNPSETETSLIEEFKHRYDGRFPFANLKNGHKCFHD